MVTNGFLNRCVCCPTASSTGMHVLSNGFLNRYACVLQQLPHQVCLCSPIASSSGKVFNSFRNRCAVQRLPQEARRPIASSACFRAPKVRCEFQDPWIRKIPPPSQGTTPPLPTLITIVGHADFFAQVGLYQRGRAR
ncbi:unnamed protein product [Ectocarpus sp. 8 AP-2014]